MNDAYERISRELESGERLLWSGQPTQGVRLTPADGCLIPFSLLWCGFAIFWTTMTIVLGRGKVWFMTLLGIPFVLVGLYLVFGRFFADAASRRRTYYGVTDRRLILVRESFGGTVKSKRLATLSDTERQEKADGSGTLVFEPAVTYNRYGRSEGQSYVATSAWPGASGGFAFVGIPDVRGVQSLIEGAAQAALRPL